MPTLWVSLKTVTREVLETSLPTKGGRGRVTITPTDKPTNLPSVIPKIGMNSFIIPTNHAMVCTYTRQSIFTLPFANRLGRRIPC